MAGQNEEMRVESQVNHTHKNKAEEALIGIEALCTKASKQLRKRGCVGKVLPPTPKELLTKARATSEPTSNAFWST